MGPSSSQNAAPERTLKLEFANLQGGTTPENISTFLSSRTGDETASVIVKTCAGPQLKHAYGIVTFRDAQPAQKAVGSGYFLMNNLPLRIEQLASIPRAATFSAVLSMDMERRELMHCLNHSFENEIVDAHINFQESTPTLLTWAEVTFSRLSDYRKALLLDGQDFNGQSLVVSAVIGDDIVLKEEKA